MTVTFVDSLKSPLFDKVAKEIDKKVICFQHPNIDNKLYYIESLVKTYILDKEQGYFLYQDGNIYPTEEIEVKDLSYKEIELPEDYNQLIPVKLTFKDLDELNLYLANIRNKALESCIGDNYWEVTNEQLINYYNQLYRKVLDSNRSLIHNTYLYHFEFKSSRGIKPATVYKVKADGLYVKEYFIDKKGVIQGFVENTRIPAPEFAFFESCPKLHELEEGVISVLLMGTFHEDF